VACHHRVAVANPRPSVQKQQHRIGFIRTLDVNFLRQATQHNHAFLVRHSAISSLIHAIV